MQNKGHGLSSTDEPSKSASLHEPVGTLSSTSLGYCAREAVDGAQRFNESADHLTLTTVMTGQAVAKAVKVQVTVCPTNPCMLVCLAVSWQLCLHAGEHFASLASVCLCVW